MAGRPDAIASKPLLQSGAIALSLSSFLSRLDRAAPIFHHVARVGTWTLLSM